MLQQLINGLILGSIYALLALGYTMVYGIIKLINFAHGDIYMMGAFMGYYLINHLHLNFFLALLIAMLGSAFLGAVIEYLAYRPLRKSTRIAALITAIGVSFLLEYGMVYLVGADTRAFPQAIHTVKYNLGPITITNVQLIILGIALLLMLTLQFIVQKTKMGKAMRALSVDSDAAQLMGINVNRTISFTFALGSALAGAGGVLIGLYYNSVQPLMGVTPGLKAFVAAVLGGIGAYAVAIIGVKMPTYVGFLIAILVGTLVAGGIALGVGIPTLRLKGDYLAIATLGVAEIIRILLVNGGDITNGAAGIMGIPPFTTWSLVYGVAVVSLILAMNFLRSPLGRNTIAIREDEIAAESMGVDTTKVKVIVFVFGAILASIAGSLQAGYVGTVMPKDFSFMMSVNVLIIVVLGGLGSMTGTVLAAILLGLLNMLLQDYASVRMIIYALALILIMIFRPSGLLGTKELTLSHLFRKTSKGGN
ncbi:TPA: ABC transporter permease [Streptococcus agalactiae]